MGKVFWKLINCGSSDYPGAEWFHFKPDYDGSKIVETVGNAILSLPYSVTLRYTALRMLTKDFQDRITARDLLKICRNSLRSCDEAERLIREEFLSGRKAKGFGSVEIGSRIFADEDKDVNEPPPEAPGPALNIPLPSTTTKTKTTAIIPTPTTVAPKTGEQNSAQQVAAEARRLQEEVQRLEEEGWFADMLEFM